MMGTKQVTWQRKYQRRVQCAPRRVVAVQGLPANLIPKEELSAGIYIDPPPRATLTGKELGPWEDAPASAED